MLISHWINNDIIEIMHFIEIDPNHFSPEPASHAILMALEEAGFTNPVLIGGALRDDYLRQIVAVDVKTNDYDVGAVINPKILGDAKDAAEATAKLRAYLKDKFPGADVVECDIVWKDGVPCHGSASFKSVEGNEIQLHLVSAEEDGLSLEQILSRNGTAPISSIVMDKNGRVLADAKFMDHTSQRIYQPYQPSPQADERGRKLSGKIPGLTIMPSETEKNDTAEVGEDPIAHNGADTAGIPKTGQQWSHMPRNHQGQRSNRQR